LYLASAYGEIVSGFKEENHGIAYRLTSAISSK
jgi:hypothetical protein